MNEVLRTRLLLSANIAANARWEGDISGLAFAMLHVAGINIMNGYFITSENHINAEDRRKADIIVEVVIDRRKILVIECKLDVTHPRRSRQQLAGYMQDGRFPHGMLMTPTNSTLFTLDLDEEDAEVVERETYGNIINIDELLIAITEMRVDT